MNNPLVSTFAIAASSTHSVVGSEHDCETIITLFNQIFLKSYRTRLIGGGDEPEYIPSSDYNGEHTVIFTHDYFASALHEIAHWCIAGEQRRQLPDYGYWYAPDGRTDNEQQQFEAVEAKPQAIEWLFSRACGSRFRLSADNLTGEVIISDRFKKTVLSEVKIICTSQNTRAIMFAKALAVHYRRSAHLSSIDFSLSDLL
ncbi:MAG: elongation factor P hydroxylase [Granulosicoccus sp.]|jgi:elongation factor P hydroxylase